MDKTLFDIERDIVSEKNQRINELREDLLLKDSKIKILEGLNHTLKVKCDDLIEDLDGKTRELRKRWERIEELTHDLERRTEELNKETSQNWMLHKRIEELNKKIKEDNE